MNQIEFIHKITKGNTAEELVLLLVFIEDYLVKLGDQNIFRPLGITKVQFDVFNVLEVFQGKVRLCDMSKHLFSSAANLSGILRRMEKEGFITRKIAANDRREITVHITKKGKEKYATVRKLFTERISYRFQKLTEKEQKECLSSLQTVFKKIFFS